MADPPDHHTHDRGELPPEVADAAADRLLALRGAERDRELSALVAAQPRYGPALQRLAQQLAGADAMLDATFARVRHDPPSTIGGHRVVKTLGEGAFGVVYLCAQERPVVRDVAIKVLRPGAGDERTLRRFAAERQVLATLNHPSITQVFDAGDLPDGRPFFVMEYVEGPTIRAHCEAKQLGYADRLQLFVQLCRGVAHAHARGIVHRDLKPANVLVVDGDDGPLPKVIDFGIAKALFATASGDTTRTDPGRVIGTPGYMSPEQAAGRASEVDARADVFALGVMLYELLTGELPWTDGAAATDTEPQRPSLRVTTSTQSVEPAKLAQRRQLAAALRGDLDWITLKALARTRDERYATVHELIADIERHLRGETVSVGPPSLRYRLRKFGQRHRTALAVVAGGALLVTGLLLALMHASNKDAEAVAARSDAKASMTDARAIVARLLQRADDPRLFSTAQGDVVRKALSDEALHLAGDLVASDPGDARLQGDRCDALQSVAQVHWLLGEPTLARAAAADATQIATRLFAGEPTNLRYRDLLGGALRQEGRALALAGNFVDARPKFAAAIEHLAACAASNPRAFGVSHATALREAVSVMPGDAAGEAIDACRRALAAHEALADHGSTQVREGRIAIRLDLASRLLEAHRYDETREQLESVAPLLESLPELAGRAAIQFHGLRGRLAWAEGGRETTLVDFQAAADAAATWCAAQPRRNMAHRFRIDTLKDLGRMQNLTGAFDASSANFRQAIAAAERLAAEFPDDPTAPSFLIASLCDFAYMLRERFQQQQLAEASACITRAIEVDARMAPVAELSNRLPRWQLLAIRAGIEESRGGPDAGASWQAVDAVLPAGDPSLHDHTLDILLEALTGIANWRLARGEIAAALQRIGEARTLIEQRPDHRKRLVEIGWLEARIAATRGDLAAIDAAAASILEARPTWFGRRRAADCMHLAWRTALQQPAPDAAVVADYHHLAVDWYDMVVRTLQSDVAATPNDPWYVLPWGFCRLRLAELADAAGDPIEARMLLTDALSRLEAVRSDVQHDQWDAAAFATGCALRDRLTK